MRIYIWHSNTLLAESLAGSLTRGLDFNVTNIRENLENNLIYERPDIIIIELSRALEILSKLHERYPEMKYVILVPLYADKSKAADLLNITQQFVLEDSSSLENVTVAINNAYSNQHYIPKELLDVILTEYALYRKQECWSTLQGTKLTAREKEILALVSNNSSNKNIARKLHLSLYTVKNHIHNILDKLNADSRSEACQIFYGGKRKPAIDEDTGPRAASGV